MITLFILACCVIAGRADRVEEEALAMKVSADHKSGRVGSDFAESHPWFDPDGFQKSSEPDQWHRFMTGGIHLVGEKIQEVDSHVG